MTGSSELTTWDALPQGGILVLVNSPEDKAESLELLFASLAPRISQSAVYVVAEPLWGPRLEAHGFDHEHLLLAADAQGRRLELNHFLESPQAGIWIRSKSFEFIVGTAPHSLYNEEVKYVFEERLVLFVGRSRFLAHALPANYLYVFDLAMLRHRAGRAQIVADYLATCRSMVNAWHQEWIAAGRPREGDRAESSKTWSVLVEHLGPEALAFDESTVPLKPMSSVTSDAKTFEYLQNVLARTQSLQKEVDRRDQMLVEEAGYRQREIDRRDKLLVDEMAFRRRDVESRQREIDRRDEIIAATNAELGRMIDRYDHTIEGLLARLGRKLGLFRKS